MFTSPSLRVPGLCQSKLEDHIGGPEHVRDSLIEALAQGIGVTAKVSWLTRVSRPNTRFEAPISDDGASIATNDIEVIEGKTRWIHCTPLTGSDGKVGVIMIIMVDKQDTAHNLPILSGLHEIGHPTATGEFISPAPPHAGAHSRNRSYPSGHTPERWQPRSGPPSIAAGVTPSLRSIGSSKLYADYMKEIRETQKRVDSFSSRMRESQERYPELGSMATAVPMKAISGRGRLRTGGTF